jgi:hypothetical protein
MVTSHKCTAAATNFCKHITMLMMMIRQEFGDAIHSAEMPHQTDCLSQICAMQVTTHTHKQTSVATQWFSGSCYWHRVCKQQLTVACKVHSSKVLASPSPIPPPPDQVAVRKFSTHTAPRNGQDICRAQQYYRTTYQDSL